MKYFCDNCVPLGLVRAIAPLASLDEHIVIHLGDKYPPKPGGKTTNDPGDPVWLHELGQEGGWIIISGDKRILKNPHNLAAFIEANLPIFVFAKGFTEMKPWDQMRIVAKWWTTIEEYSRRIRPGDAYEIPTSVDPRKREVLREILYKGKKLPPARLN